MLGFLTRQCVTFRTESCKLYNLSRNKQTLFNTRSLSSISNNWLDRNRQNKSPLQESSLWYRGIRVSSYPWRWDFVRMAGHSKWQNIRHIKGAKDKEKSQASTKIIQKLNVAILEGGGADPKFNRQLQRVIDQAGTKNIPKATIDAALKRAKEKKEQNERLIVCAVGPGGCFLLLDVLTDKPMRTRQELNGIFKRHGTRNADMKMAAFSFNEKGVINIVIEDDSIDMDQAEELAIEAGAEEVEKDTNDEQPVWKFICDHKDLHSVKKHLVDKNLKVLSASHEYIAINLHKVNAGHQELLTALFDKLEAHSDVVKIYDNIQVD